MNYRANKEEGGKNVATMLKTIQPSLPRPVKMLCDTVAEFVERHL